ncbi:hypothetical protein DOTSEDRAFT_71098 [Dothistroma septosporum NZE10]|uniref:Uncharacterized protein n=1 Tax=Dothistroma septosporum (strain NZE10 / CBS 128990) TaxID=675120 RepID=N1PPG0_DOTSN|nr:hypothetical protein DOTSEDRAFT_71098 [Dothistroma septosporum NZE10]
MPPRIQARSLQKSCSCQCIRSRPDTTRESLPNSSQIRHFTSSESRQKRTRRLTSFVNPEATRLRRNMQEWLNGPGKVFREPLQNSTNYMSAYDRQGNLLRGKRPRGARDNEQEDTSKLEDVIPEQEEAATQAKQRDDGMEEYEIQEQYENRARVRAKNVALEARGGIPPERLGDMRPYPLNHSFRSERVLSEELREAIYNQVVGRGTDISTVSAMFSIDVRRVAAVVRLKTVEKQWIAEGKQLAKPYNDAVLAMLPQTTFRPDLPTEKIVPHETINDLPVHPRTRQQMFYPVSESRQFTREDAAKAFDEHLLPADKRIAHPDMIASEKDALAGMSREQRFTKVHERDAKAAQEKREAEQKRRRWEERTQRVVPGRRWDFKFQDVSAEKTGKDGRARYAVGARYGMPHEDRKSNAVKIPTSVE